MNKKILDLNIVLFVFLILSFIASLFLDNDEITIYGDDYRGGIGIIICLILFAIITILNIYQFKKKDRILKDNKYLLMFTISNILTIIILLRAYFDSSFGSVGSLFVGYNIPFILSMYTCTFIYSLINTKFKK